MTELVIRPARPGEASRLGDLGFAAWEASEFGRADAGRTDRQALLDQFRSFGDSHGQTMLVAEEDGALLGWGAREDGDALISDLWVGPHYQGRGVGGALLVALERQIVAAGYEIAELETLASNVRAIQFYEQHGFMIAWRGEKFSSSLGYAIDKVGMNKSLIV
jgi:[ribosomal protein S18]-alanine N-acetyltransferase